MIATDNCPGSTRISAARPRGALCRRYLDQPHGVRTANAARVLIETLVHPLGASLADREHVHAHSSLGPCLAERGGACVPQLLELIELARLGDHDMDDDIAEIHQRPLALAHTLGPKRG